MDSNTLLDEAKKRLGIPSDYALAKHWGIDQTSIGDMRRRGLSDERVLQIAALLEIDPGEPLAAVRAERAKDPAVKAAWHKVAESVRTALGLAAAVAVVIVALALPGKPALASPAGENSNVYYVKPRLRRLFACFRAIGAALALFSLTPAHAGEWFTPLTHADRVRLGAYYVTHVIDWGQTLYIAEHPEYRETNSFLSDHPTRGEVNRYFVAVGLLHYGAVRALPRTARPWFQYITIVWNSAIIANNVQLGIHVDF